MKIGIPKDYLGDGLDPEVKSAILAAADELKKKVLLWRNLTSDL